MDGQGSQGSSSVPQVRPARPLSVTLLAFLVLSIAGSNLTRTVLAAQQWKFIQSWPGVSPLYILLSGLVWTLAGLTALWGLWRGLHWGARLTQALALTYALYYWLDNILRVDHPFSLASGSLRLLLPLNWKFAVGVTVILLTATAWILNRRAARAFFGDEPAQTIAEAEGKNASDTESHK